MKLYDECTVYIIRRTISTYYTSLPSNHINPISKHVSPRALGSNRHMRGMGEGNRFF